MKVSELERIERVLRVAKVHTKELMSLVDRGTRQHSRLEEMLREQTTVHNICLRDLAEHRRRAATSTFKPESPAAEARRVRRALGLPPVDMRGAS
jgi:DNA integrity scanning protein DisA with diadenylate cyclase activity